MGRGERAGGDLAVDPGVLRQRLAPVGVEHIRPLPGGASSLTFVGAVGGGGTRVVVKVAPPGLPPVLNRDVLRQARLLRALHATAVPVPEVLWEDAGDPPDVPPLFVMTFVEGTSLEPLFDPAGDDDPPVVADRMRDAARVLGALHALPPEELGLGGEPTVGPGAEVDRWCRLLETVDPALVPGWDAVANVMRARRPPTRSPVVVHGDFRLGNLLAVGSRIHAVIDWEIWSRGDPRVDLGWFLMNADPATFDRRSRYRDSLPTPAELLAVYGGRGLPDLEWFRALACFKSAATWSLIVKHNRRRSAPDASIEQMAAALPHLLDQARDLVH
jgi:aminoglycoside phosphotransferase (APT) family kinase protein